MGRTSDANERLMTAALDLMWEESYGAVTIDDICKRADVKKGSFYYFFQSKAHLAVAALEKMWTDEWKPRLDASFSPSIDPLTRLTAYLDTVYEFQAGIHAKTGKVLGCPVCTVGSEISTQEVDVSAKIREIMSRKRRYYESAIRDAMAAGVIAPGDPAQKAQALFCLIEGAVTQARIMNEPELLRAVTGTALDMLRAKTAPVVTPSAATK
jgi:TetR/AcrR family transcriptional regulator, transcriptional repressor for nem operon